MIWPRSPLKAPSEPDTLNYHLLYSHFSQPPYVLSLPSYPLRLSSLGSHILWESSLALFPLNYQVAPFSSPKLSIVDTSLQFFLCVPL